MSCPTCGDVKRRLPGVVEGHSFVFVGFSRWFFCDEHRVKWFGDFDGSDLWREETAESQHAEWLDLGLDDYETIAAA